MWNLDDPDDPSLHTLGLGQRLALDPFEVEVLAAGESHTRVSLFVVLVALVVAIEVMHVCEEVVGEDDDEEYLDCEDQEHFVFHALVLEGMALAHHVQQVKEGEGAEDAEEKYHGGGDEVAVFVLVQ